MLGGGREGRREGGRGERERERERERETETERERERERERFRSLTLNDGSGRHSLQPGAPMSMFWFGLEY